MSLLITAGLIFERAENHKSNECQSSVKIQIIFDLGLENSDIVCFFFFFQGLGRSMLGMEIRASPTANTHSAMSCTPRGTCELQYVFQVLVKETQILMKRNFQNETNLFILSPACCFLIRLSRKP